VKSRRKKLRLKASKALKISRKILAFRQIRKFFPLSTYGRFRLVRYGSAEHQLVQKLHACDIAHEPIADAKSRRLNTRVSVSSRGITTHRQEMLLEVPPFRKVRLLVPTPTYSSQWYMLRTGTRSKGHSGVCASRRPTRPSCTS